MEQFFLFQYRNEKKSAQKHRLVIFCAGTSLDTSSLKKKLRDFFSSNYPPNEIILIGGDYLREMLVNEFISQKSLVFDAIQSFEQVGERIEIITYDIAGNFKFLDRDLQVDDSVRDEILQQGLYYIFFNRGGLIKAPSDAYHYIFPSGKHSSKFIRAGNVLIDSSEIFFIALSLLKYFKNNYSQIYCDTSSINSLAFAVVELRNRFKSTGVFPSILSFGSYEKFEKFDFRDSKNSIILISASTSGNIIRRLLEYHSNLRIENILVLFYLSEDREFSTRVVCDLTRSESNPTGIELDDIYPNESECQLCERGSYKVKISGDVFLLEKPHIQKILIGVKDAPQKLSSFMQEFYCRDNFSLIRCFFGEEASRIFECYLDTSVVESYIDSGKDGFFKNFLEKYFRLLNQHIPSRLKYIIYLPDKSSKLMADRVLKIHSNSNNCIPEIISSTKLLDKDVRIVNEPGSILIVSSCLVTGSNFLYINKFLRRYEKLGKTFIVAFARTSNNDKLEFIRKNICQGDLGTTQLIHVEKIFCSDFSENSNDSRELSWQKEMSLIKKLIEISDNSLEFGGALSYLQDRLTVLESATDLKIRGLVNNVFLKNPISNKPMILAKNFAFFNFDNYHKHVSQADVYFTIASILNQLRNSDNKERRLIQEEYVRTIIDPENFTRFDDGIIQSALIRTATEDELNYQNDFASSTRMREIIFRMIDSHTDHISSEALIEFLFALAIRKMRLIPRHLAEVVAKCLHGIDNVVLKLFVMQISDTVLRRN